MTHKTLAVPAALTDFQKNLNQAAGQAGPKEDQQQHILQEPGVGKATSIAAGNIKPT